MVFSNGNFMWIFCVFNFWGIKNSGKKTKQKSHTLTLHYVLKDLQPWNLLSYAGKFLHDFIKYTDTDNILRGQVGGAHWFFMERPINKSYLHHYFLAKCFEFLCQNVMLQQLLYTSLWLVVFSIRLSPFSISRRFFATYQQMASK